MNLEYEDDDLLNDIHAYSELEVDPVAANSFTIPKIIQRYQQKIEINNSASVFDTNYYLDSLAKHEQKECSNGDVENKVMPNNLFLDDEHTIKVSMGRGRGGRNTFYRPGELGTMGQLDNDEALMQEIRKVNPVGYSNAITEQTVKAHYKKHSVKKSPNKEPDTTNNLVISPLTSSSASTTSDVISAYYSSEATDIVEEEPKKLPEQKPPPITQLLQQSRELKKQRQILRQMEVLEATYEKKKEEVASRRAIEELLRRDMEEEEKAQKYRGRSSSSSTTSSRDDGTPLSWRRRSNSPPRFQWTQPTRRKDGVNIHSCTDFPPLK